MRLDETLIDLRPRTAPPSAPAYSNPKPTPAPFWARACVALGSGVSFGAIAVIGALWFLKEFVA